MSTFGSNLREPSTLPRSRQRRKAPTPKFRKPSRQPGPRPQQRTASPPHDRSQSPPGSSSPRRLRFTTLPATPEKTPKEYFTEQLQSWSPSLRFPFDVDMNEYNPEDSRKLMEFKQQRSELARQKYLDTVERCREAVEGRRRRREEEHRLAKQRTVEREVRKLREKQEEVEEELAEEGRREEHVRAMMEREIQRINELQRVRAATLEEERVLDVTFEQQLDELRNREQDMELFISRRIAREKTREELNDASAELEARHTAASEALQQESTALEQRHIDALLDHKEHAQHTLTLHQAMELGRTMRLAGVTRATDAHKLGLIRLPLPPPP